jgi:DNA-binding IclR family transcriptional regulator
MIKVFYKMDAILQKISDRGSMSFTAIQTELGMNKATLSNLLKTLLEIGYVARDPRGNFSVGPVMIRIAKQKLLSGTLAGLANDIAQDITERLSESVTVSTIRDNDRFILSKTSLNKSIIVNEQRQSTTSFYTTATGRVLLAYAPDEQMKVIIEKYGLPGDGWPDVKTRKQLMDKLKEIRQEGIESCHSPDGLAEYLAVPVVSPEGTIFAAIGSGIPSFRLTKEYKEEVQNELQHGASRMADAIQLSGVA